MLAEVGGVNRLEHQNVGLLVERINGDRLVRVLSIVLFNFCDKLIKVHLGIGECESRENRTCNVADGVLGVALVVLDDAVEEINATGGMVAAGAVADGAKEVLVLEYAAVVVAVGSIEIAKIASQVDTGITALSEDRIHTGIHRDDDAFASGSDQFLNLGDVQRFIVGGKDSVRELNVQRGLKVLQICLDCVNSSAGILIQADTDLNMLAVITVSISAIAAASGHAEHDTACEHESNDFFETFHGFPPYENCLSLPGKYSGRLPAG